MTMANQVASCRAPEKHTPESTFFCLSMCCQKFLTFPGFRHKLMATIWRALTSIQTGYLSSTKRMLSDSAVCRGRNAVAQRHLHVDHSNQGTR